MDRLSPEAIAALTGLLTDLPKVHSALGASSSSQLDGKVSRLTQTSLLVAALTWLLYDWLICVGDEVSAKSPMARAHSHRLPWTDCEYLEVTNTFACRRTFLMRLRADWTLPKVLYIWARYYGIVEIL
jgi:hypothetical protein